MNAIQSACTFLALFTGGMPQGAPVETLPIPWKTDEVQVRQVISVVLNVPSSGKESKRVLYSPPPGWYIRSHRVALTKKQGLASFTVTTVPAHWASSSEEISGDKAALNGEADFSMSFWRAAKTKVAATKERNSGERQTQSFSHHALVVEATAQGGGFLRSGAAIELTVTAEMVYIGKD